MRNYKMKILIIILLAFFLSSCVSKTNSKTVELKIFAAASMTETLTEIAELYKSENPGVTPMFNFDSSGTLKTQIEAGADCGLFISAAQKQVNELEELGLTQKRVDLLENRVVLVGNVNTFDEMAELLAKGEILLAMGNSDVPVGQYSRKILEFYGLNEAELNISYASNVKEVFTQVIENSVDCGIIYATDAISAGLAIADYATYEMCGEVIYPVAVLNENALDFLEFLTSEKAVEIFERAGFKVM